MFNNGVFCVQVWPPLGLKKFETLSYLPPLTIEQLSKEVDYLIRSGWIPCLEFELEVILSSLISHNYAFTCIYIYVHIKDLFENAYIVE